MQSEQSCPHGWELPQLILEASVKTMKASMTARKATSADDFYGLDEAEFAAQVAQISVNDRRLEWLFHKTRMRYLEQKVTPFLERSDPIKV
jgi:hypothetical protein